MEAVERGPALDPEGPAASREALPTRIGEGLEIRHAGDGAEGTECRRNGGFSVLGRGWSIRVAGQVFRRQERARGQVPGVVIGERWALCIVESGIGCGRAWACGDGAEEDERG